MTREQAIEYYSVMLKQAFYITKEGEHFLPHFVELVLSEYRGKIIQLEYELKGCNDDKLDG